MRTSLSLLAALAGWTLANCMLAACNGPQIAGETTKESGCTALRYLREAFGDLEPKDISRLVVTEWMGLLARKPAAPARAARRLKLRELVERYEDQDVRRLSPKTLEQYDAALSARWRQAAGDGSGVN